MTKARVKKPKARAYSNYLKEDAFIVEMRATSGVEKVALFEEGYRITSEWTPFRREEYFEESVLDLLKYDGRAYSASSALPYEVAMCVAWSLKACRQGYLIDVRVRPCEVVHSLSVASKSEAKAVYL